MNGKMLLNALKGAAVGGALSLFLLLIFNVVSLKSADPDHLLAVFAYAARFAGGAAAGFAASRFHRSGGLLSGALAGAFLSAVLLLGAAFSGGEFRFLLLILLAGGVVAAGAVGGILGLPGEKSETALRKRMMKRSGMRG